MSLTQTGVRLELADTGSANVATGLPVLDHVISVLAAAGRFAITLEVAPGGADELVAAAGQSLGAAVGAQLRSTGASGRGRAWLPSDEALAGAVLEITETPLFASNVDFSDERVGGHGSDIVARFLESFTTGASLNLHIRVLEGRESQHVVIAIFKALGAALGQACRPQGGNT
ncbi:MAG: hypothetical protein WCH31_03600 [Actinomycetes bacterium]